MDLIYENVESEEFENFVRATFGVQAHPLYNLDQLFASLGRQIRKCCSSGNTANLIGMYIYEKVRFTILTHIQSKLANADESSYQQYVNQLSNNEDYVYLIEYKNESLDLTIRENSGMSEDQDLNLRVVQKDEYEEWTEYVNEYVDCKYTVDERNIFLHRYSFNI